jgi:hypothetical protein
MCRLAAWGVASARSDGIDSLLTGAHAQPQVGILSTVLKMLHPLHYAKRRIKRAVIPRPIRRAAWVAGGVAHPVSRVKYSVRRGVIRGLDKAITPKPRRRPRARGANAAGTPTLTRQQAHDQYRQRSFDELVQLQEKIAN